MNSFKKIYDKEFFVDSLILYEADMFKISLPGMRNYYVQLLMQRLIQLFKMNVFTISKICLKPDADVASKLIRLLH